MVHRDSPWMIVLNGERGLGVRACVWELFCFPRVFVSPVLYISPLVVSHIRAHVAGSPLPSPLRLVPYIVYHKKASPSFFALADSRRIVPTEATRSQQGIVLFCQYLSQSNHGAIRTRQIDSSIMYVHTIEG